MKVEEYLIEIVPTQVSEKGRTDGLMFPSDHDVRLVMKVML